MNDRHRQWASRLLAFFCKEEYLEEIEGDIMELFAYRQSNSLTYARRMLWWDVMKTFRWVNIKKPHFHFFQSTMFSNYFKTGFRSLKKDLKFSLLNITGLAVGLCVFIVMLLMARHEYTFDEFHVKADRIYQVIQLYPQPDGVDHELWTSFRLSEAVKESIPEVEEALSVHSAASNWVEIGERRFFEEEGIIAGSAFFRVFDFQLLAGNRDVALKYPRSTVISEDLSKKYFWEGNPIGQTLHHEFYGDFTVTGVFKNVPSNSYIQFEYVLSQDYDTYFQNTASWYEPWFKSWSGHPVSTFVVIDDTGSEEKVERGITQLVASELPADQANEHCLINMRDLHFEGGAISGNINRLIQGDENQLRVFMLIAFVILVMACLNYINLAIARSIRRNREVGVRKSIGARRNQIVYQFLMESSILVAIALLMAVVMAYLTLPYFQLVTGITFNLDLIFWLEITPWLIATCISVSLLAGFYPALVLSRFPAVMVLKQGMTPSAGKNMVRNVLMTIQFMLVIGMSAALLVVSQQFRFLSEKSLGFDTDQLLVVEINSGGVRQNFQVIKNELSKEASIKGITGLTRMFSGYREPVSITAHNPLSPENQIPMKFYGMDERAVEVLGLGVLQGQGFQGQRSLDSASVLINESAARLLGADALGSWIQLAGEEGGHGGELKARVVGIVKDFHFESLHVPIRPVVLGYYLNPFVGLDDIVFKIDGRQVSTALSAIEKVHNQFDTNDVMTWEFLDDMANRAYANEMKFRNIFSGSSVISLVLAVLGMVGLIAYSMVSRIKEFGIRKVFGATFLELLRLQGNPFMRYILFAAVMAIPVSAWLLQAWLGNFAYRIALSPWPFVAVLLVVVVITALTVLGLGRGLARLNPARSLREE